MKYTSWQEAGQSVTECIIMKCGRQVLPREVIAGLVIRSLQADTHWKLDHTEYISKERLLMILNWDHKRMTEGGLLAIRNNIKVLFPMTWRFVEQMCL